VMTGSASVASIYGVTVTVSDGVDTASASFSWAVSAPSVSADSPSLVAGGTVTVSWSGIATPTATDWISLVPAGAADAAYIAYWFTTGTTAGSRVVTLPEAIVSGTYELRLFAQNTLRRLAVGSPLTISGPALTAGPASLTAGATVTATWSGIAVPTSTDWIAFVPTGSPDAAYVAWGYTGGTSSGSRGLSLPPTVSPGTYELRLFAHNSLQRLAVSNTVTVLPTILTAGPGSVPIGGTLTATWSGIGGPTATDWVVLTPTGAADTTYVAWGYTGGSSSGSRSLTVPSTVAPGTYELRLFAKNGFQRIAVSNSITVQPPTITASPAAVAAGGALTVTWQGHGGATDWLALVPVGAADTSYVAWAFATGRTTDGTVFPIPAGLAAGDYEVRFFANNSWQRLGVSNPVTVMAPAPSLTASPVGSTPGGTLTVSWQDIAAPTALDWIGLYTAGAADTGYITRWYTSGRATDRTPRTLPANLGSGEYELRLFTNDSLTRLTTSNRFTVAAGPSVSASPLAVAAGATLTVNWAGIDTPTATDWVTLIPLNGLDNSYVVWSYTTGASSGSLNLVLPASVPSGTYEVRLFAQNVFTRLAVSNIVTVGPTLSMTPAAIASGGTATVSWAGIVAPAATDWLALVPLNAPDASYVAWSYTSGLAEDRMLFVLPSTVPQGLYTLRFFAHNTTTRLAISDVVSVTGPGPSLSVSPATAVAGGALNVSWNALAAPTPLDWIGVYSVGADDGSYLTQLLTNGSASGNTSVSLPAVVATGPYELRLFSNGTFTRIAVSNGFTVKP
jgi:hypothetical protein